MKKLVFIMSGLGNPNDVKRIEEAVAFGLDVEVYAFGGRREGLKDPEGVNVTIIEGFSSDVPYWKRIGILKRGINSILEEHNESDCIYYLFRSDLALAFTFLSKRPYIFEEADMVHANFSNTIIRNVFEYRLKKIIKNSLFSVFRSEGFIQYHFGEKRPDNVIAIPNKLHPEVLNLPSVNKEKIDNNCIKYGFVGSIRYDTIYNFAYTLLTRFPQHEFHFFGQFLEKKQEEKFMQLSEYGNCFFHGPFRSPNDLPQIYNQLDIVLSAYDVTYINPRYAEPNKLYEAIYFDTPIIVSSNSFLAHKVEKLGVGYDVDAYDKDSIVKLVRSINVKSIKEKKDHISAINKETCINNNRAFFQSLKEKLQ